MRETTGHDTHRRAYHVPECHMGRMGGRLRRIAAACEGRGIPFSYSMDRGYVAKGYDKDDKEEFMCRIRIVEIDDGIDFGDLRIAGLGHSVNGEWETIPSDAEDGRADEDDEPVRISDIGTPYDGEIDIFDEPDPDEDIPYGDGIDDEAEPDIPEGHETPPAVVRKCSRCGSPVLWLCVVEDASTGECQETCARCLSEAAGGIGTAAMRDYAELTCLLARLSGSRGLESVPATRWVLPADLFVACCLLSARREGYVSGRQSVRDMTWWIADRMASCALGHIDVDTCGQLTWRRGVPDEIQELVDSGDASNGLLVEARQAMEWMLSSFYTSKWADDTRAAIRRSLRDNLVERRDEGLLASLSRGWLIHSRDQEIRKVAEELRTRLGIPREHTIGEPGEHVRITVSHAMEVERWHAPSGQFVRCIYILVTDKGDVVMWRTTPDDMLGSSSPENPNAYGTLTSFAPGELSLSATVVRHEEYEGSLQTVVTNGRTAWEMVESPEAALPSPGKHVHPTGDAVGLGQRPRRSRKRG